MLPQNNIDAKSLRVLTVVRSVLATNDKTEGLSQEILEEGP